MDRDEDTTVAIKAINGELEAGTLTRAQLELAFRIASQHRTAALNINARLFCKLGEYELHQKQDIEKSRLEIAKIAFYTEV